MRKFLSFIFTVLAFTSSGQDSLFLSTEKPPAGAQDKAVELGMVFQPSITGEIIAVKFYKTNAADASTYRVAVWNMQGIRVVSQDYAAPGKSGWQRVMLGNTMRVNAGEKYIVSYYTPKGYYSGRTNFFTSTRTRGKLTAPSSNAAGGNGRYAYGNGELALTKTYLSSNYYVDVVMFPDVRQPLIVNAGRDTTLITPLNGLVPDYQLNGFVSGDSVSFSWRKMSPMGLSDTMLNFTTLNPVLRDLASGQPHHYILRGVDKWGSVYESGVTIDVEINPKKVVIVLMRNGQKYVEIYQDGTFRRLGTGGVTGTWFFDGMTTKGFESELTDIVPGDPPPPPQ